MQLDRVTINRRRMWGEGAKTGYGFDLAKPGETFLESCCFLICGMPAGLCSMKLQWIVGGKPDGQERWFGRGGGVGGLHGYMSDIGKQVVEYQE